MASSGRQIPRSAGTRSNPDPIRTEAQPQFAKIKTRDSYKAINVELMEVIVELVARFLIPESKASEVVQLVLNKLCEQHLILPSDDVEKMEQAEVNLESDDKFL